MWQPYCNVCEKYIDRYTYIYICNTMYLSIFMKYICYIYLMLYIKYFILLHYTRLEVLENPFRITSVLGVYIYGSKGDYISF